MFTFAFDMETSATHPGLTTPQFYAMAVTLLAAGIGYLFLLGRLAVRDSFNQYKTLGKLENIRSKLAMFTLITMAVLSFFFLPDLFSQLKNDAINRVAEEVVEFGSDAITTDPNQAVEKHMIKLEGLIWGWPQDQWQKIVIYGIPLCAVLLGITVYVGMMYPSPVGAGKKSLKFVAWCALLFTLLQFNRLHYFNGSEIMPLLGGGAVAAVCIFLSQARPEDLKSPPEWFKLKYGTAPTPKDKALETSNRRQVNRARSLRGGASTPPPLPPSDDTTAQRTPPPLPRD